MPQVSLDASGEHQIANTPTPASQQQHGGKGADSESSPALSAQAHTPNENGEHDSMESTHGGHLGKLQASLTKSAAFQLPPTPTPAGGQPTQPATQAATQAHNQRKPPAAAQTRPATGAASVQKAKHGRLGMLSESLDASLSMQLPPTPNPAVSSGGERQGAVPAVPAGAAEAALPGTEERGNGGSSNAGYSGCIRALLEGNGKKAALDCASLMVKYFGNVQENPHEEKYRRIPKGNKAFKARVAACAGSAALLQARRAVCHSLCACMCARLTGVVRAWASMCEITCAHMFLIAWRGLCSTGGGLARVAGELATSR